MIEGALLVLLTTHATQDGLDTEHEFLHGEGLGNIVIGTKFEALKDIFLQCLSRQEDNGDFSIGGTDFLCQCEAVLLGHHHIEYADIELSLQESLEASLAVGAEFCLIALGGQILTEQHAEVLIILAKQNFQFLVHNYNIFRVNDYSL